jgi:hypothetical protein
MPYIKIHQREQLDKQIESLAAQMRLQFKRGGGNPPPTIVDPGVVNYVVTKLLLSLDHEGNYANHNALIGALECCKLEYYRRAISPYEDKKIQDNSDVYHSPK